MQSAVPLAGSVSGRLGIQALKSTLFSSWDCSLEELLEFGKYVQKKAELAIKGEGDFRPGENTCRFCRAKGRCRARADRNMELAFAVGKKPPLITNAEMGEYLEKGADVEKWLSDLKELALKECLSGKDVPGWKAVEGRGTRSWTDQDKAFEAVKDAGIDEAMLYVKSPLSLAKVEELMGKKAVLHCWGFQGQSERWLLPSDARY